MNLLAIDIGNSGIKSALFKNDKPSNFNFSNNPDSLIKYYKGKNISSAAVSSVVPEIQNNLVEKLEKNLSLSSFIITKKSKFSLKLNYETIKTLGIDRICSAEGAFHLYKKSREFKSYNKNVFIISIDCGTATTINIIKFPGEFIGGVIAPGLKVMFESLNKNTSQLPLISSKEYKTLIGNSTKSSIASGVINSNIGLIEKTISHLEKDFGARKIKTFITGRNVKILIPHLQIDYVFEKSLVLYGINAIFKNN